MKRQAILRKDESLETAQDSMEWHQLFIEILQKEFGRQKAKNSKLSMRQWAKRIGVSSGAVSELLGGRRKVTQEKAVRIIEALGASEADRKRLLAYMGKPTDAIRIAPKKEDVNLIKDWVNHAICGLYELNAVTIDAKAIAERLGVPESEIEKRTATLLRRGLLKMDASGKVFRKKENWDLSLTLSPTELLGIKENGLDFAKWAMGHSSDDRSFFLNFTFPGNAQQIEFVRQEIKKILNTLDAMTESEPRDELVRLSLQLFPFRFRRDDNLKE